MNKWVSQRHIDGKPGRFPWSSLTKVGRRDRCFVHLLRRHKIVPKASPRIASFTMWAINVWWPTPAYQPAGSEMQPGIHPRLTLNLHAVTLATRQGRHLSTRLQKTLMGRPDLIISYILVCRVANRIWWSGMARPFSSRTFQFHMRCDIFFV